MPELVTLTEDGPLGVAGTEVWVDSEADVKKPAAAKSSAKPAARKQAHAKPASDGA